LVEGKAAKDIQQMNLKVELAELRVIKLTLTVSRTNGVLLFYLKPFSKP